MYMHGKLNLYAISFRWREETKCSASFVFHNISIEICHLGDGHKLSHWSRLSVDDFAMLKPLNNVN